MHPRLKFLNWDDEVEKKKRFVGRFSGCTWLIVAIHNYTRRKSQVIISMTIDLHDSLCEDYKLLVCNIL